MGPNFNPKWAAAKRPREAARGERIVTAIGAKRSELPSLSSLSNERGKVERRREAAREAARGERIVTANGAKRSELPSLSGLSL